MKELASIIFDITKMIKGLESATNYTNEYVAIYHNKYGIFLFYYQLQPI